MKKGSFNLDREKKWNLTTLCRISSFFFLSLQIFLYQRLVGLQRREKIGRAVKNDRTGREMGMACKHH